MIYFQYMSDMEWYRLGLVDFMGYIFKFVKRLFLFFIQRFIGWIYMFLFNDFLKEKHIKLKIIHEVGYNWIEMLK